MNSSILKIAGEEAFQQNVLETKKRVGIKISQAEYDALSQEEKTHGLYYIYDGQASGNTGSIVYVHTDNTSLYGKNVTLTDDDVSVISKFDNSGDAVFDSVAFTGRLGVEASDGTTIYYEGFNAPYYGKYNVILGSKVKMTATLAISTTSEDLFSKPITIKKDGEVIGTTAFSAQGSATYTVHETGTYTCECEGYSGSATVSAETTYPVTINAGLDLSAWITAGSTTGYPLNPSSYADFSALEADEAAIRQLMTVHASVDYLAQATAGDSLMESVIGSNVCAKWINLSDYALDTLYANSDIADEMDTADKYGYGEWGIIDSTTTPPTWGALGNVPIMTSNTAPYGTVSAISSYNSTDWMAYCVFNPTYGNGWLPTAYNSANQWIQYDFVNPINIKKIYVQSINSTYSGVKFKVEVSNDGSTWTDISNETYDLPLNAGEMSIPVGLDAYYSKVRLTFTTKLGVGLGSNQFNTLKSLQFYGRELPVKQASAPTDGREYIQIGSDYYTEDWGEKEFAAGSTRKTIYDHGVEVVSMTALHDGSATATKESNQLYGNTTSSGTPSFAFITSAQVNFPSGKYSRLCGKVGNKAVGPASYSMFFYGVKSTGTYTYSDSTLVAEVGVTPSVLSGGALENALDVSSITGDYYVLFCAKSNSQTREASCVELWLE